ncbi:MarR family winged helix-turn-helix transcriptional regulator [Amycolatopsis sp.]|uniref:MarR family winged helix-turn-helix transcriptional regulator n=1 Tax=Amycolatopsis sp. TaxID=37632 RepID=UPI002B5B53AB|nr:MarR family winged helix-turn-helix transcriptional regulator [Amycolatopsis sp.]HVV09923.1 MarR family winged helix-turn-helix transcriptional regulator [Amycolatopsis sp.]
MRTVAGLRRLVRRQVRAELPGRSELTGAQLELLREVKRNPGIGVAAAARALHLAGNSVSTLVNQLVSAGMLERKVDPADRRAVRLEVTAATRERLDTWQRIRTDYVARKLHELSEEDTEKIAEALPALGKLLAIIQEDA